MIDLDTKGIYKYKQTKGIISPNYSCFANNLCQGYEIFMQTENCWSNIINYHKELPRIPDKLMYFMRNEPMITEMYKFYYPNEYNKWITDPRLDKDKYSNDSIPPNEVFKIMCIGFNLFIHINKMDMFNPVCKIESMNYDKMKKYLSSGIPIISSFELSPIKGHIMTIKGYDKNDVLVYDTYGCSYLNNFELKGKSNVIPYKEFLKICKPTDSTIKNCIVFI